MPLLDALTKRAAIVSVLAIAVLQLLLHPDATWTLRAAGSAALVIGWITARMLRETAHAGWLIVAPLAPAILMVMTGRQGEPLLDPIWMAGLAAFVVRSISWSSWSFPPLWRPLLGGWALLLAVSWPILAGREIAFDPAMIRDLGAINSWAEMSAPHVVAWTLYVVLTQLLGLLWFDMVYSGPPRGGPHENQLRRGIHGLWIGVTAASVVAIVQGTIDLSFLSTTFWAEIEARAASTMLNSNAYGVAAACAGPIAFIVMRRWGPRVAITAVFVLAINWAGLWLSGSRTAFVCGIAGATGLAVGLWRSGERAPGRARLAAGAALAVLVGVAVLGSVDDPLERLREVPLTREGLSSLRDRGTYGPIADQMIREYPIAGVGVGAFHYLAPDYERVNRDDRLPFDNAQNWWRHQAAELGLVGASLPFVFAALVGWQLVAGKPREADPLRLWTVRGLMAGLAATSMLGMPTQAPVVLLLFFLLVAWLNRLTWPVGDLSGRALRAAWAAALLAVAGYAGTHVVLAGGPLSVDERARRFRHEYVAGAHLLEPMGDGPGFRWTDDESRFILPARSPFLMLRLWTHHPDVVDRPVHVALRNPCGVVFERDFAGTDTVSVWIEVPSDLAAVDMTVTASRTWSPADTGGTDARRLGVGVSADFQVDSGASAGADHRVVWRGCRE